MALPDPEDWLVLPSVSRLMSRPAASFVSGGAIWEIGWNGAWVQAWRAALPAGSRAPAAIALPPWRHRDDRP